MPVNEGRCTGSVAVCSAVAGDEATFRLERRIERVSQPLLLLPAGEPLEPSW